MRNNPLSNTVQGAIDDPMGTIKAIPSGFNRGVAGLAGLPVDTVTSAVDLLGMAYGAGRSLARKGTLADADEFYTPIDRSRQFGTGENLAGLLDRGSIAIGGSPVTQNTAPNNPAARLVYAGAAGIPGAVSGRMALAGGAGGAASQVVAEAGGDPAAQAAAGLIGGRVAERPMTQRSAFGPDSGGAAAAGLEIANVPKDLQAPLVQAFQRGERDVVERVARAQTLPIPITLTEGMAKKNGALIADELNRRGTDPATAARFDEINQQLIDNLDEVRRQVSPNVVANDHVQNGQALIDSYKTIDEPVRAEITAAYKALEDANGGQLPINGKSFVDAADAALERKLATDDLPPQIRGKLEKVRKQGGMLTFEQFESLRTDLATAARDADRGTLGGGGNAAKAIRVVRDQLESMPIEGVGAEVKALADRARALARARFDRMRQDPAYEAAIDDPTPVGELSPSADDFVQKFVVRGKTANINRMRENLAADPVAGETIAAAALNFLKKRSGIDLYSSEGNFSQKAFNNTLGEMATRLEAIVPREVADTLRQIGDVAADSMFRPKGAAVNVSNPLVSSAVKNIGEAALNKLTFGAKGGTLIRGKVSAGRERAQASRSLDPRRYLAEELGE